MSGGRPRLIKRALDLHPFHHRAESALHRLFHGRLRHDAMRRDVERVSLGHRGLIGKLAEFRRAHLVKLLPVRGAGGRLAGEGQLKHDVSVRAGSVGRFGQMALLRDHGPRTHAESIALVRHGRRPRAERPVRRRVAAPVNGQESFGRYGPRTRLKAVVPVVPRFGVVEAGLCAGGRRRRHGSCVESAVGGLKVAFQVLGGEVERGSDVLETTCRRILRQESLQRRVRAQQIMQRIRVLRTVQPAKHDPPIALLPLQRIPVQVPAQGREKVVAQFSRRAGFSLGRHLVLIQQVENPSPKLLIPGIRRIPGECGQVKSAFLLVRVVAIQAMRLKHRLELGAPARGGGDLAGKQGQRKGHPPRFQSGESGDHRGPGARRASRNPVDGYSRSGRAFERTIDWRYS